MKLQANQPKFKQKKHGSHVMTMLLGNLKEMHVFIKVPAWESDPA
jgi:hypothetical protein